ncbi:Lactose transport system permease protein LacF [Planctomycetes bacterium Pla86]|uniref:Lactose transport system permease protein LacF n=1 Tax=Engelhardtia mirabilis TaxID=2528011 RepID=A0A518BLN0_9BACT|nr:Lactose transport system permease protein LacF [Planctomycetes bacterium Pla133]QDV02207.1 Lactose transport system permease protein LacF [Planctomycetes bacterium Pla86]
MPGQRTTLGQLLRKALGLVALLAVVWAFARVGVREFSRDPQGESGGAAPITLTVMHWSGDAGQREDDIVEGALAQFERQNPGLRVQRINPGDAASFYTKLQTMMAAGTPPDAFYIGSERLAAFATMGLLEPLQPFVDADLAALTPPADAVRLDDYFQATVDAYRYDGSITGRGELYGIPKDFTTVGFYYNIDLFRRAGVPLPADDWSWDDYVAAARAIGALEGCTGSEFVTWPPMLRAYLGTEGLDIVGESFDDLRLDEPEVFAAFDRLRSWRHDERGTLTSGKSKIAEGSTVFLTGTVGMAGPFGRWVVPSYRNIPSSAEGGFDWDFAPLPRGTRLPDMPQSNTVLSAAWAMSSRAEHPQETWKLIRALVSPETQAQLSRLGLAVPTLREVARSDAFIDPTAPPRNDQAFLDAALVASVQAWPATSKFEPLFKSRLDAGLKTGNIPLRQAITEFENDWALESSSPLASGDFEPVDWVLWRNLAALGVVALLASVAFVVVRGRGASFTRAEERAGLALVSPWLVGFAIFMAFPIGLSLVLSFSRWNGASSLASAQWVGLGNYAQLIGHDDRFLTSLRVTAFYVLLAVPLGQAFALAAALLMNVPSRAIGFFRAAWYLPSVLAGVGVSVLWRWVFDGDAGLLNTVLAPVLALVGLTPPDWFGRDAGTFGPPAFALQSLWMVGGSMMIYLAGLKGIPQDLYEAAAIDGAKGWRRFRSVTLPMLSPVIFFNGIMAIIGSFQVFTQAFVMTGGGPGDLTRFYVLYVYNQAFEFYEMGYASALAWMLLVVVLVLTVAVMWGSKRFVHYEGMS